MDLRGWSFRLLMLHTGEGRIVFFLSIIAALTGFGLTIGRASSDALFFTQYGVDHLPLMFALIALVLIPCSLAYAAFVDRLTPYRMFVHLLLGFGVMVGTSWGVMRVEGGAIGIASYFIAYGVISELLLTHFSHYVCSFFDAQQAKRLLPAVMAISRLGAILGGVFLGVAGSGMATEHVALVWTACLAVALGLVAWWHRGEPIHCPIKRGHAITPVQMVREGLMFARQSRLVRISALGMFLVVFLLSVQEHILGSIFAQHYPDEHDLTVFFGWFTAIINACLLVIQLFLFGRLTRRFGLKTMNLIYPITTLLSFGLMTISAGYLTAVLARINAFGVLPGIRNTVAGFFFHALPGYMQGRAHALIAGLVLPLGLLVSALFLWVVPHDAPLEWVAGGGFVIALALLWVKLKKNEAYADSLVELVSQSVFTKDGGPVAEFAALDRETAFRLAGLMRQTDSNSVMLNYADLLESLTAEHAGEAMLAVYPALPPKLQDQLLLRIARLAPADWQSVAWEAAQHGDAHLTETTARILLACAYGPATAHAQAWLDTAHPRLRSAVAVGYLHGQASALRPSALKTLKTLLQSAQIEERLAALGALVTMPHEDLLPWVRPMLGDDNAKVRTYALNIWSQCASSEEQATDIIENALNSAHSMVRCAAIASAARLPFAEVRPFDWLSRALRDMDYRVRSAGRECAKAFMPTDRDAWINALAVERTDFDLQNVMISELAASSIESKHVILRQATNRHIRQARDKLQIRESLAQLNMPEVAELLLLMQVLREEARRHLDIVLHILGSLDQGQQMNYIRAGLSSRDRHLWAQTMESAMQHKQEGRLFHELALLYEVAREGAFLGKEPPGGKRALRTWLVWCQEHGSEWLAQCAGYCLSNKRLAT